MRYEDIRNHVQKMLQAELARRLRVLKDQGPERFASTVASDNARALLAEGSEVYWGTIGRELQDEDLKRFSVESRLPFDDVLSERSRILPVIHRDLLAMLAEFDVRKAELEAIDIGAFPHQVPVIPKVMPEAKEASRTLAEVVDLFINEHVRVGVWVERARSKQEATLGVLIELLGGETPMASITKKQAQDVKAVLLTLPANKNKNPKTRDLSLRDAAKVPGVEPMSPTTLNGYLGAFHTFMEGLSL